MVPFWTAGAGCILYYFDQRFIIFRINSAEKTNEFCFDLKRFLHTSKKCQCPSLNLWSKWYSTLLFHEPLPLPALQYTSEVDETAQLMILVPNYWKSPSVTVLLRPKVQVTGDGGSWTEQHCDFAAQIGLKTSKKSSPAAAERPYMVIFPDCREMNTKFSEQLRWRMTYCEPLVVIVQYARLNGIDQI